MELILCRTLRSRTCSGDWSVLDPAPRGKVYAVAHGTNRPLHRRARHPWQHDTQGPALVRERRQPPPGALTAQKSHQHWVRMASVRATTKTITPRLKLWACSINEWSSATVAPSSSISSLATWSPGALQAAPGHWLLLSVHLLHH